MTFRILISLLLIVAALIIVNQSILIKNTKNRIHNDNLKQQSELIKYEVLNISDIVYHYMNHNHDKNELLDYLRKKRFGGKKNSRKTGRWFYILFLGETTYR
ncbi:MAG: hypothetical protein PF693_15045 [Spirochaetia bacterium]|nr:hypothetical protein [Spirochaetia bacterium]